MSSGYRIVIEEGKVAEFARAVRAEAPEHRGDAGCITPTFLTVGGNVWEDEESKSAVSHGLDRTRTLHAEEEYVFHGPLPRVGDVLWATPRIVDRHQKQGRRGGSLDFVTRAVEFRDEAGRLVAEQRSVAVQTSTTPAAGTA